MAKESDGRWYKVRPGPLSADQELVRWVERELRRLYQATQTAGEQIAAIAPPQGYPSIIRHTQLLDIFTQPEANPHQKANWVNIGEPMRGAWQDRPGVGYAKHDVVRRGAWTMISNTDANEDDPEPTGAGNRRWLTGLGDTPTWTNTTNVVATTVMVGMRVSTPSDEAYFRYTARVWIPVGATDLGLSLWVVTDPLGEKGEPQFNNVIPEVTLNSDDEDTWRSIGLGRDFLPLGTTFDVIAIFSGQETLSPFSDTWDAKRKNDDDVASGEVWHGSNQGIGSKFSYAAQGQDRETDLKTLRPGDEIVLQGNIYEISDTLADDVNNAMQIWTQPHLRPAEGTYSYTFNRFFEATIPYVDNGAAWSGSPNIQGLFSSTGYNNLIADQIQYGVDIEVETVIASPLWDPWSYTGQGGSTGGGGTAPGTGGETLLQTIDATGLTEIVFNIPPGYVRYRVQYDGIASVADNMQLALTFSTDNGSSYIQTGYCWSSGVHWSTDHLYNGSGDDIRWPVSADIFISGNEGVGELSFFGLDRRIQYLGHYFARNLTLTRDYIINVGGTQNNTHGQITNLRIASTTSSTEFARGTFRLYGL